VALNNQKMEEKNTQNSNQNPEGTATHSGWSHFYVLFSKYRDECIKIGQVVFGTDPNTSIKFIRPYHSSLYSMAQQVFSFYDTKLEKEITNEWMELQDQIVDRLNLISDRDFRNQMVLNNNEFIPRELKVDLLCFFNKIDRLAAEAGLLVGKENKGLSEPKKGLIGFSRK